MGLSTTFRAFESRNYRLFFFGQVISRMGTCIQRTAVIWVIYTLTDSVFWVGLTIFAEQFPSFILSPAGGIAADQYSRQKIVIVTQVISAIQAVALTLCYYFDLAPLWLLLLLSAILGIANAYDIPARQAMVNELVSRPEYLPSAIAMNSSLNNLARLAGPAVAGIVMAKYGATFCFATNALSYIIVIACLVMMKLNETDPKISSLNRWENFKNGYQYARNNSEIANTLLLIAMVSFFVITYNTLQPYFAKDVFGGDSSTFGYINAATGLGALFSTLYLASQNDISRLKRILFNNLILLAISLLVMSYVPNFHLYLVISFFCGFGTMSIIPICNTVVQTVSRHEMRGRVVGFFAMATLGTIPIGSVVIGWITHFITPQLCQFLQGIISLLIAAYFYKFLKQEIVIDHPAPQLQ